MAATKRYDYYDKKKDKLYCSINCAVEDGCNEEDLERWDEDDWEDHMYDTEDGATMPEYGNICDICESVFNNSDI